MGITTQREQSSHRDGTTYAGERELLSNSRATVMCRYCFGPRVLTRWVNSLRRRCRGMCENAFTNTCAYVGFPCGVVRERVSLCARGMCENALTNTCIGPMWFGVCA